MRFVLNRAIPRVNCCCECNQSQLAVAPGGTQGLCAQKRTLGDCTKGTLGVIVLRCASNLFASALACLGRTDYRVCGSCVVWQVSACLPQQPQQLGKAGQSKGASVAASTLRRAGSSGCRRFDKRKAGYIFRQAAGVESQDFRCSCEKMLLRGLTTRLISCLPC